MLVDFVKEAKTHVFSALLVREGSKVDLISVTLDVR